MTTQSNTLAGQVALITGASRGIGAAIALELGQQGAIVVGTATSDSGAAAISQAHRMTPVAWGTPLLGRSTCGSSACEAASRQERGMRVASRS